MMAIASSLGVDVQRFLDCIDQTPAAAAGKQPIGEACGGIFLETCSKEFGKALPMACATCPN